MDARERLDTEAHVRELRELLRLRRNAAEAEIDKLRRTVSGLAEENGILKMEAKLKELQLEKELKAARTEIAVAQSAYEAQLGNTRHYKKQVDDLLAREEALRAWIEDQLVTYRLNKHAREWLVPVLHRIDGKKMAPATKAVKEKWAAVSIIRNQDRYLCVWNTRYNGWSFPGGLVEEGEAPGDAQERELMEESGLRSLKRHLVFAGPTGLEHEPSRAGCAAIYAVTAWTGDEKAEEGSEVKWLTRDEYLAGSPFASFYRDQVFPKYDKACSDLGYPVMAPYYVSR